MNSPFEENTTPQDDALSKVKKEEHPLTEIVRFSLIAILIVVPVRMFIAQPFIVSGASMEETFQSGEYLIVDQLSYHFEAPARGEVIIFKYPKDPSKYFIKRVIGLPGETIEIIDGEVIIKNDANPDGFTLSEPYIEPMPLVAPMRETLGSGEYFVMGDNRPESSDSRSWGVLQEEKIIGRAFLRLFPPTALEIFPGNASDQFIN
mgnify:FL=1